ncbi:MAG: hypothetical protein PF542_05550 [Nanoarchaeota archaeon]|jgi:hypothetical protein|nr:hypothetical protein [Nanoarchaeota archaeon]
MKTNQILITVLITVLITGVISFLVGLTIGSDKFKDIREMKGGNLGYVEMAAINDTAEFSLSNIKFDFATTEFHNTGCQVDYGINLERNNPYIQVRFFESHDHVATAYQEFTPKQREEKVWMPMIEQSGWLKLNN